MTVMVLSIHVHDKLFLMAEDDDLFFDEIVEVFNVGFVGN
jgi:hypothetical protein